MRRYVVMLVALLPGASCAQEVAEPEPLCTISGVVLAPDAEPLRDSGIRLYWLTYDTDQPGRGLLGRGGGDRTTGPQGEFQLTDVMPGFVRLTAMIPGMLRAISPVARLEPGQVVEGLQLKSSGYGGGIVGTVVDEGGRPVEGAYVNVNTGTGEPDLTEALRKADEGRYTTRTAADGWFAVDTLAPGQHDLSVYYWGYPPCHRSRIEIVEGAEAAIDVVLRRWLPNTWTLAGVVTDPDGVGVPGASIDVTPGSGAKDATSGDAGEFLLYGLPLGTPISARAYHPEYGVWEGEFTARQPEYREDTVALAPRTRLTGTVLDPDGRAVADEQISIYLTRNEAKGRWVPLPEVKVTTDQDGGYTLVGVLPGEWRLRAPSARWRTYSSQPFVVTAGANEMRHDITFPPGGTIAGLVLGPDREPLADRHVLLHSGERHLDRTLARPTGDGSFRFTGVEPGTYCLSAAAPGFWPAIVTCDLAEGANIEALEVQLGTGASISGVVLDAAGDPVPGTRVLVDSRTTEGARDPQLGMALACRGYEVSRTDPAGRFTIRGMTPGVIGLVAFKGPVNPLHYLATMVPADGIDGPVHPAAVYCRLSDGTFAEAGGVLVTLEDNQDATGVDIRLAKWIPDDELSTVKGRVLDPSGQLPADPPLQVVLSESPLGPSQVVQEKRRVTPGQDTATADADGRFDIPNVAPGEYYLLAGADTTFLHLGHVTVAPGQDTALGDLRVPAAGALQGTVRDKQGDPIREGWAVAARAPQEARPLWQDQMNPRAHRVPIGPDGSYRFDRLEPGFWFVTTAGGRLPGSVIERIFIDGATESLDFNHTYIGRLSGRVLDPDGNPVPRASVRCEGDRCSWTPAARSDEEGGYEFSDLPHGPYTLRATHPFFLPGPSRDVELSEQRAVASVDFVLRPGALIAGRLIHPDGSPVTDGSQAFTLELHSRGRRVQPLILRDDGTFRSRALEAGTYTVTVRRGAEEVEAGESEPVTVSAGQTAEDVTVELTEQRR